MNSLQILRIYTPRVVALHIAVVALLIVSLPKVVSARETYVAYATRIVAQPPEGAEIRPDMEAAVLRATNSYRASKQYPALKSANKTLLRAARAHALDLMVMKGMGHTSSTGHDFASRVQAFNGGQMVLTAMGENAARLRNSSMSDAQMAQALVQQWIKSPSHRKSLVSRSYVEVAIGVVKRGNDVYAVQIFSGPKVKTNMFGGTAN